MIGFAIAGTLATATLSAPATGTPPALLDQSVHGIFEPKQFALLQEAGNAGGGNEGSTESDGQENPGPGGNNDAGSADADRFAGPREPSEPSDNSAGVTSSENGSGGEFLQKFIESISIGMQPSVSFGVGATQENNGSVTFSFSLQGAVDFVRLVRNSAQLALKLSPDASVNSKGEFNFGVTAGPMMLNVGAGMIVSPLDKLGTVTLSGNILNLTIGMEASGQAMSRDLVKQFETYGYDWGKY